MKTLYLDCAMGAAGDMLAAALLELLDDRDAFVAELNALGLPPRLSKKELVEALNRLYTFEQLDEMQLKILND